MLRKLLYATAVIFILGAIIGRSKLEFYASYGLYPFLVMQKQLSNHLSHWWFHRQSAHELAQQLERYIQLHDKLQQEVIQLRSLNQYKNMTQDLRDYLQRYKTDGARTGQPTIVQVLLKHFDKDHFYLIDAGSRKGLEKDMIAVYKDCLVGRVSEVYPYYSKVVLITDPSCKVAACCTSTQAKGVHEGNHTQLTKLSFVDHLQELKGDDLIISSGEGLIFPRGFGLGRIKSWDRDGHNCTVTVEPLIDFKKIEYCSIIQKGAELQPAPQQETQHESEVV